VAKHEGRADFEPVNENMPAYRICHVVEVRPVDVSAKSELYQKKPEEVRLAVARYLVRRGQPGDRETARDMGFDPAAISGE